MLCSKECLPSPFFGSSHSIPSPTPHSPSSESSSYPLFHNSLLLPSTFPFPPLLLNNIYIKTANATPSPATLTSPPPFANKLLAPPVLFAVPALSVAEPLLFAPPADAVLPPLVLLLNPEPEPELPEVPVDLPPVADEVSVPFVTLLPLPLPASASPLARGYWGWC